MGYATRVSQFVVPYDHTHRPALQRFQQLHFGGFSRQSDSRVFEWLFERNPNRRDGEPVLWLYTHDGEVIGQQGTIPVVLKASGREWRAAWGIDLMVHPAWHLKGVAPALISTFEASADICLGLGLSDSARRLFLRRGWSDMGRLPMFVRLLRPRACATDSGIFGLLAKTAPSTLFSASARLVGWTMRTATKTSLELVPQFDAHVDGIWAASSEDYPVLVKRDYTALRWRFDEVPGHEAYARYYLRRGREVVGYAVTRWDTVRGLPVVRVVDYLAPRQWLAALLASLFSESERTGAAAVMVEHLNSGTRPLMRALGCWRFADSTQLMVRTRPVETSLFDAPGTWFVTQGDSDCDHLPREH